MLNSRPAPNQLANTSLILGVLGWLFYLLQWCFDLTIGLLLAAVTGGASAICSSVLDFLPLALWLTGIVAGHVALGQIRQSGVPGRARAVWGLVFGYVGMSFTLLFILIIVILIATGIGVGFLNKTIPTFRKY